MVVSQRWENEILPKFYPIFSNIWPICAKQIWCFSIIRSPLTKARKVQTHLQPLRYVRRLATPLFSWRTPLQNGIATHAALTINTTPAYLFPLSWPRKKCCPLKVTAFGSIQQSTSRHPVSESVSLCTEQTLEQPLVVDEHLIHRCTVWPTNEFTTSQVFLENF